MRVVDTSVWVETLVGGDFGGRLQADLPGDDEWRMPTIVQLELSKWIGRERSEDLYHR